MKNIIISGKEYGPFSTVEIHNDHYNADGCIMPFSVYGSDGVIGDYTQPVQSELVVVPSVITIRQAKLILLEDGILDEVDSAVSQADRSIQIEWEYATEIRRNWPALLMIQSVMNLSNDYVDDLFIRADKL